MKMLADMIPVMVGVLIALFIENWKETSNDKRFVDQIYAYKDYLTEEGYADWDQILIYIL